MHTIKTRFCLTANVWQKLVPFWKQSVWALCARHLGGKPASLCQEDALAVFIQPARSLIHKEWNMVQMQLKIISHFKTVACFLFPFKGPGSDLFTDPLPFPSSSLEIEPRALGSQSLCALPRSYTARLKLCAFFPSLSFLSFFFFFEKKFLCVTLAVLELTVC